MAKLNFIPQPTPPASPTPGDFWAGGSSSEGGAVSVPFEETYGVNIPIPPGVSLGYAIMINILGLGADGLRTCLQRFTYACFRDSLGVLRADGGFGSDNDMQEMESLGASPAEPAFSTGALNADSIDVSFVNNSGNSMWVSHQLFLSPGIPLP